MKKLLFTALLIFASTAGFAQKMKVQVDKESGTITVNEVPQAILIKENAPGQLGINKNFTITNLDGKELLYFVFTQEPETNSRGYKTGKTLTYYTLNFIESGGQGRRPGTMTALGAAKIAMKNGLIVDGEIDPEAQKEILTEILKTLRVYYKKATPQEVAFHMSAKTEYLEQVEAISHHHFVPCRNKVLNQFLLCIR